MGAGRRSSPPGLHPGLHHRRLDGYLARRRKQITTLGMLLDPLADKLMVTAAYIILVAYNPRIVPPWIAVIIIGREFLVSGLRSIAASEASPSTPPRSQAKDRDPDRLVVSASCPH